MGKDTINAVRRASWQYIDQTYMRAVKRLKSSRFVEPFKSPTRFSLVTVNFSTTYYLKLMLLTLCEQEDLAALCRIVVVDNNSKDGGVVFLGRLAAENEHIHLLKNKVNCTHANGLRKGIEYIDKLERSLAPKGCSNALLVCDTDIVFRNRHTLRDIGAMLAEGDTPFAGELRHNLYPYPEAQASFFAVRRDCYARPEIDPIVHHGAPAYFMQRSMWKAGLRPAHFPSNQGGYILHRGRSAVSAANKFHRFSAYSTTDNRYPHYMGVENGESIWSAIEERYQHLLQRQHEQELLERFRERFGCLASKS